MSGKIHTFVPFNQVHVDDAFWNPRLESNRAATIPAIYDYFKKTGRIDALKLAWKPGQQPEPHFFWDSDVAKWVEAASFSLVQTPDPGLGILVDQVVDLICSAQQPDGYINVYFTVVKPEARWTNLRDLHELYTAGHLIEAAVAHHQATGSRKFLDAMCRYADLIAATFGTEPGQKRGYCGHEEIELALVKLYHATGQERYLKLAQYFVDERGNQPYYFDTERTAGRFEPWGARTEYDYMQAHKPLRQQSEVTGHAVRAMYIYTAMADLAAETGDAALRAACRRLWDDVTLRKMYLTGGLGSSRHNEGFTAPYDLPNLNAYGETCAAIGLIMWAQRMLRLTCDSIFGDVLERALYNGAISGVSLDGARFFYENPLASTGRHRRQEGFGCSCCPPNLARLLASLGGYVYSTDGQSLAIHLYMSGHATIQLAEQTRIQLSSETKYPWEGQVTYRLNMDKPTRFDLKLRVPAWCAHYHIHINGQETATTINHGYATISRTWTPGDTVIIAFDMTIQRLTAHPAVHADQGRVAIQRGPLVYCLEDADHPLSVHKIVLPDDAKLSARWDPTLLSGVTVIEADAQALSESNWSAQLYRHAPVTREPARLRAIPYYAWENRAPGGMAVWLPRL